MSNNKICIGCLVEQSDGPENRQAEPLVLAGQDAVFCKILKETRETIKGGCMNARGTCNNTMVVDPEIGYVKAGTLVFCPKL